MNTMQANGKFYIFEHPQNLIEVTEGIYNEIKSMQQQYKSIVKTVDPDNLPEGEVLCIGDFNRLLLGQIDYCTVGEELFVFKNDDVLSNPTHYIEQKDLIKLFKDSK